MIKTKHNTPTSVHHPNISAPTGSSSKPRIFSSQHRRRPCLACTQRSAQPICEGCRLRFRHLPPKMLANGLGVWSVFEHIGPARKLIHRFKYHGMSEVARLYAPLMEALIPPQANGLVPIPRVKSRIIRYGFDPALVLANLMAEHCGLPVYTALSPAWWGRVHAGRQFSDRKPPRFGLRFQVPPKMVLVDDVVTTGLTLLTASSLLNTEPIAAITATCTPVSPHNANDKPPENSTKG